MSNEAKLNISFSINNGNQQFASRPSQWIGDITTIGGPSPGQINVTEDGVDIDLSALSNPGHCWIVNLSSTVSVLLGRWDDTTSIFYPHTQILPGMPHHLYIPEGIGDEYEGTGTGTSSNVSTWRLKSLNGTAKVVVQAFER